MNLKRITFVTGALVCVLSAPVITQGEDEWVAINNPAELRAIYSNKTFKGVTSGGTAYVGHYSADGRGVLIYEDKSIPRTWAVKGNDQVCATDTSGTTCYVFWRHRDKQNVFKNMNVEKGWTTEFTVEDGIPKF